MLHTINIYIMRLRMYSLKPRFAGRRILKSLYITQFIADINNKLLHKVLIENAAPFN